MKRKNFITTILVGAGSATLLNSCASESNKQSSSQPDDSSSDLTTGLIVHNVFFWLKEGITEEEEKDFLNFFEELKKAEGPRALKFGKPAPTHPRPVVDNSFSYYLLVTFDTMDGINTYETHPIHLAAIEKYQKYWTKVEVKDAILS